jgi:hypothetical protein
MTTKGTKNTKRSKPRDGQRRVTTKVHCRAASPPSQNASARQAGRDQWNDGDS